MLRRHDRSDILVHWFNAACWLVLLITGLGLIDNPRINPLGAWLPAALRSLFGGGATLLVIHEVAGLVWLAGLLAYLIANPQGARAFLAETFRVDLARDPAWMLRKMLLQTLGPNVARRLGIPAELPDQGFYNMGQKAFGQVSVIGGLAVAASGLVLFLSGKAGWVGRSGLASWAATLHWLAVGLVLAGLLVHIYMAAISPEERPGLKSMFSGHVPEDYAEHHHRLWFKARIRETQGSTEP
jgi:formate dehydrogenase subunit gamma